MAEPPRRFPLPWHADKVPGGHVVRDANGQALAYLYSRDNEDDGLDQECRPPLFGKRSPTLREPHQTSMRFSPS